MLVNALVSSMPGAELPEGFGPSPAPPAPIPLNARSTGTRAPKATSSRPAAASSVSEVESSRFERSPLCASCG